VELQLLEVVLVELAWQVVQVLQEQVVVHNLVAVVAVVHSLVVMLTVVHSLVVVLAVVHIQAGEVLDHNLAELEAGHSHVGLEVAHNQVVLVVDHILVLGAARTLVLEVDYIQELGVDHNLVALEAVEGSHHRVGLLEVHHKAFDLQVVQLDSQVLQVGSLLQLVGSQDQQEGNRFQLVGKWELLLDNLGHREVHQLQKGNLEVLHSQGIQVQVVGMPFYYVLTFRSYTQ